jgi:uncharacterized protein YjbI with pentapeptide repeats
VVEAEVMNRDEARKLLKGGSEGVAKWNHHRVAEWSRRRSAGEGIPSPDGEGIPSLELVELEGAYLAGAIFVAAILTEANLKGANLEGAYLAGARLDRANLKGAYLHEANLKGAYLGGANLHGAKLHGARLDEAKNLTQEQLDSARGDLETEMPEGQGLVRPKSWEQTAESKRSRRMAVARWSVMVFTVLALVVLLIWVGYKYPEVSGFGGHTYNKTPSEEYRPPKTVWDWMGLFGAPVGAALLAAAAAAWFTQHREKFARESEVRSRREERVLEDRRSGAEALQKYLDSMTGLMLEEKLQTLVPGVEVQGAEQVREMARARTLAVLQGLDGVRKGTLLRFLYESKIISKGKSILQLRGADFLKANLFHADLHEADLSYTFLRRADLHEADLHGADLHGADLGFANLREADLSWADLGGAYLGGTDLSGADLGRAYLRGADLDKARLHGAYLDKDALTQEQLKLAIFETSET